MTAQLGGPERTEFYHPRQSLSKKWDMQSFHTIIRLFAASVPLELLDNALPAWGAITIKFLRHFDILDH
jgi:hypothetical protein